MFVYTYWIVYIVIPTIIISGLQLSNIIIFYHFKIKHYLHADPYVEINNQFYEEDDPLYPIFSTNTIKLDSSNQTKQLAFTPNIYSTPSKVILKG